MRKALAIALFAGLLVPAAGLAEYRQVDLTIFGMD